LPLLSLLAATLLGGCHPAVQPKPTKTLGVLTALPLFWGEGNFGAAASGEDQRAPVIQMLSSRYRVSAVDVITPAGLSRLDILMLAQPRRLAPAELVDLETWVQKGGRLIIFADPLLDWPSDLPLGDTRCAPPVTLLDPLFDHWGLELSSPKDGSDIEFSDFEGQRMASVTAGSWTPTKPFCQTSKPGMVAQCQIGRGAVLLVGDADLLDARLWDEAGTDNFPAITALFKRLLDPESHRITLGESQ
jgi:ABC-type uncharacterized transport system